MLGREKTRCEFDRDKIGRICKICIYNKDCKLKDSIGTLDCDTALKGIRIDGEMKKSVKLEDINKLQELSILSKNLYEKLFKHGVAPLELENEGELRVFSIFNHGGGCDKWRVTQCDAIFCEDVLSEVPFVEVIKHLIKEWESVYKEKFNINKLKEGQ